MAPRPLQENKAQVGNLWFKETRVVQRRARFFASGEVRGAGGSAYRLGKVARGGSLFAWNQCDKVSRTTAERTAPQMALL